MYNGIGLQTPRGSGTNGYVQRNMSFVPKSREKVNYKTEEDIRKLDALANKKPNQGILAHERKRTIELKCLEMQELMEDQGYPDDEVDTKVALFRQMLLEKEGVGQKEIPKDEFGRPIVKESHQIAEANQEKNSKMREALGISQYFVEGSSLDPERKVKEAAAAAADEAKKKYTLIPDSSSSSPERSQHEDKEKKRKKKSHSSHEKTESSPKKKKSVKKHKRERSISPDVQKKKRSKKSSKEKNKHKNKNETSHKKQRAQVSSSSSSSSSDSADDESSDRSSSRDSKSYRDPSIDKLKEGSKLEKTLKGSRKRSTSSERIRYSKETRSRKDIYEAKKAKYKRKTACSSSTSSDDSSPKQYYRLEPVLLKSKSKHKKSHQLIEIPKKSAFELKKYDKKKRVWDSSSSSNEEEFRPMSKRSKRSESPVSPGATKHRTDRYEVVTGNKKEDAHKSSKCPQSASLSDKHCRNKSKTCGSPRKSQQRKVVSASEDESDNHQRKVKELSLVASNERHEKESKKKNAKKDPESPNGHSKHGSRVAAVRSGDSEESKRGFQKQTHYSPRSPSHSPVVYRHKKHIIESPPYVPPHKKAPSPPRSSKHHKEPIDNALQKKYSGPNDSDSENSEEYHKKREHKTLLQKSRGQRGSRSPSQRSHTKSKSKQKLHRVERSPSESVHSESRYSNRATSRQSKDSSPVRHRQGSLKKKKDRSSESPPTHNRKSISKMAGMTIIVESCQISPQIETYRANHRTRDSYSSSPSRTRSTVERQKKRDKMTTKDTQSRASPSRSLERSPRNDKSKYSISRVCNQSSNNSNAAEVKIKHATMDDESALPAIAIGGEDAFLTKKKTNWSTISNGDHSCSLPHAVGVPASPVAITRNADNATSSVKANEGSYKADGNKRQVESAIKSPKEKDLDNSPSQIKSETSEKRVNRARAADLSRSRSRSISLARSGSRSVSERSSRSRSYGHRGSKSYSKSRSHSYSKSRSNSRSRSKSASRSHSKSYSRSRSVSVYSRSRSRSYSSRSRSRSAARSPSIPRRRGSPSFLDKRRITSARKRPVPYRRPSPSTPSSSSSWTYSPPLSRSSSPARPSPSRDSSRSLRSRSQSWSPIIRPKYEMVLSTALR